MQTPALVTKILNHETAEVEFTAPAGCKNCRACGLLYNGLAGDVGEGADKAQVRAKNLIGAKVGDKVEISLSEKQVVLSAFLVYILPLLGFFAGYLLVPEFLRQSGLGATRTFSANELTRITCGFVFMGLMFLGVAGLDRYLAKRNNLVAKIVRVIE